MKRTITVPVKWSLTKDADGAQYSASMVVNSDMTVYAIYKKLGGEESAGGGKQPDTSGTLSAESEETPQGGETSAGESPKTGETSVFPLSWRPSVPAGIALLVMAAGIAVLILLPLTEQKRRKG